MDPRRQATKFTASLSIDQVSLEGALTVKTDLNAVMDPSPPLSTHTHIHTPYIYMHIAQMDKRYI